MGNQVTGVQGVTTKTSTPIERPAGSLFTAVHAAGVHAVPTRERVAFSNTSTDLKNAHLGIRAA